MAHKLFLLPGDGIGTEIMKEVEKVILWLNSQGETDFELDTGLVGGSAYDKYGVAVSEEDMQKALAADAVIFGAVGGPKWDKVPYEVRPEAALLRLRKDLGLFANLRPAICYPALADASSLKRELVEGLDILIVRELTGGVYFGEPKEITDLGNGQKRGVDTQVYETYEIDRIVRVAMDLARTRKKKVHSADKKNVMKSGVLWDEVAQGIAKEYSDIEFHHILADNAAMQLVRNPKQFDVMVTDNLFGDVLSDVAAMLTGSLGMLPPPRSARPIRRPASAARSMSRCTARPRHCRQGHRQPDRHAGQRRHGAALLVQHGRPGRPPRRRHRRRARRGSAHRRHRPGQPQDRRHRRNGRRDPAQAAGVGWQNAGPARGAPSTGLWPVPLPASGRGRSGASLKLQSGLLSRLRGGGPRAAWWRGRPTLRCRHRQPPFTPRFTCAYAHPQSMREIIL